MFPWLFLRAKAFRCGGRSATYGPSHTTSPWGHPTTATTNVADQKFHRDAGPDSPRFHKPTPRHKAIKQASGLISKSTDLIKIPGNRNAQELSSTHLNNKLKATSPFFFFFLMSHSRISSPDSCLYALNYTRQPGTAHVRSQGRSGRTLIIKINA